MGNNVSMNHIKTQLNNEIDNNDPNRIKATANMGLDNVTLKPTTDSKKKALSNPNFDSDYKYLIGIGAPIEAVQFMEDIKITRSQQKQSEIDTLKTRYNNITDAISMYQQDEKQIWLNYNVAKDPNYMKKRQAYLIYKKVKRLREQRDKIMLALSKEYDVATDIDNNNKQLDFRNSNIIKIQKESMDKSSRDIKLLDRDIMTKRRQYQIDIYMYNDNLNKITLIRTVTLAVLFAMVPMILALGGAEHFNSKIFNIKFANVYALCSSLLFTILLISLYLKHRKTNLLDWDVINFDSKNTGAFGLN